MQRILIPLIALLACACDPGTDSSPGAPVLVFTSDRDVPRLAAPHIYRMRVDGSELVKLTGGDAGGYNPDWSPDGSRIAYSSQGDIYVMRADGTARVAVTRTSTAEESSPRWSPDGGRILFARVSADGGQRWGIYTVRADGTDEVQLSSTGEVDRGAAWSPDGTRIVFQRDRVPDTQLYIMNSDGSGIRQLTSGGSRNLQASWSPDGSRIVFSRGDGSFDLYTIRPDGTGLRQITHTPSTAEGGAAWSPDGSRIAFHADRDGENDIFTIRADGSELVQVTSAPGHDSSPRWRKQR